MSIFVGYRPLESETVAEPIGALSELGHAVSHHVFYQHSNRCLMSIHPDFRGAAAVGWLPDMPSQDANLIIAFRLWFSGKEGQQMLWSLLVGQFGANRARAALRNFEHLMQLCETHGRRPLVRHSLSCQCAGADECCLANFVSVAASGSREDALMIAMTIVRADMAPHALGLAQQVGLATKNLTPLVARRSEEASTDDRDDSTPSNNTLH